MTSPALFKDRAERVCAFAKRATWRAGFGGSIRTVVTLEGEQARVAVDLLDDTTPDPPQCVGDDVVAKFVESVKLAAKTMGLVLVSIDRAGFVVRARTDADRKNDEEAHRLILRARRDAHDEATIHAAPNSKLVSQRGAEDPPRRNWRTSSHAEQCAGIAEALEVLRLALEPRVGTVEGQSKAADLVVRIAMASSRREVRQRAATRLRELGRNDEAESLDNHRATGARR